MPSHEAHIALATRNKAFLEHLDIDKYPDWVTTAAFYRGLHLIEAIFALDPAIKHGGDHRNREFVLKSNKKYAHIYRHYRPLYNASVVARYLEEGKDSSKSHKEYSAFSEYLSVDDVKLIILRHYLHQIELSAGRIFSERKK